MPPGLVTRTISASMVRQSLTCSSTLLEKHTSTEPERSGSPTALPTMLPSAAGPSMAISPRSASTQKARAPARPSSLTKNPGPPPTSATTLPSRSAYWPSWLTVSLASAV
jgi:hypothetical protein